MQTNTQMNRVEDDTAFRMSRIRAEGWKAALAYFAGGNPRDEKRIAALNPYRSEHERETWYAGFNKARERF